MKNSTIFALLIVVSLLAGGCGRSTGYIIKPIPLEEQMQESVVQKDAGWFVTDKVAIVDIEGMLLNQRGGGLFTEKDNPVSAFIEKMDIVQNDPEVKAVVLRINSPGGGVTAADIMYQRLLQMRKARNIPVVAIIVDVGASGGYYIACGAGTILAHPTSITGSIGVIVQTFSLAGTMKMIGIEAKAITSGAFKDMGSPLKPLDKDDAAIIQAMVNEYYGGFIKVVAEGRKGKLTEEQVKKLADGRVYTGEQAKANGLVDDIGYMAKAIETAKEKAHLGKVKVVEYHRPWETRENVYSAAQAPQPQINLVNINVPGLLTFTQPQFLYLWTGKN
ncbi:MAG: signal peptide peptidase SppA [Phycisphaerae bacterium]